MFSSNAATGFDAHIENEDTEVSQEFKSNLAQALELANSIDESIGSQVSDIEPNLKRLNARTPSAIQTLHLMHSQCAHFTGL